MHEGKEYTRFRAGAGSDAGMRRRMEGAEMTEEGFTCPVPLKPMKEWVKIENGDGCRPCVLAPVASWYHSELTERGREDLAKRIEATVENLDSENEEQMAKLCEEMDKIKDEVDEPLRNRLLEFDCEVQSLDLKAIAEAAAEDVSSEDSPES